MSIGQGVAHGMTVGFNPMMRELYALQKPIVAAVNGVAVGGGVGLALAADIVIAAKSASFVQVFGLRSSAWAHSGSGLHMAPAEARRTRTGTRPRAHGRQASRRDGSGMGTDLAMRR